MIIVSIDGVSVQVPELERHALEAVTRLRQVQLTLSSLQGQIDRLVEDVASHPRLTFTIGPISEQEE